MRLKGKCTNKSWWSRSHTSKNESRCMLRRDKSCWNWSFSIGKTRNGRWKIEIKRRTRVQRRRCYSRVWPQSWQSSNAKLIFNVEQYKILMRKLEKFKREYNRDKRKWMRWNERLKVKQQEVVNSKHRQTIWLLATSNWKRRTLINKTT